MVALNLVQGLLAYHDLEITVVHCHSDIDVDRTVRDGRLTVHYLAMPRKRIIPNLTSSLGRIATVLRAAQPDLVHAHAAHFAYASARTGYPTIFTIHGVLARQREIYRRTWFDRLRYALLAYYERRALNLVSQVVAISPYVVDEYAHIGSADWARIDNPVPDDFFQNSSRPVQGRVFYAGSIDERKGLLTLIRAIERLKIERPDVRLRIAGHVIDRAYERDVRAYVSDNGLKEQVVFLGLLDRSRLLAEYAQCSLVALASIEENSPMAIIEAMACGKAVVATRVGGVPDLVIEGETGYLVAPGDDVALARALGKVLWDAALARGLGERGQSVARDRFGMQRIAADYHQLYRQILAASGAPPRAPSSPSISSR